MTTLPCRSRLLRYAVVVVIATGTIGCGSQTPTPTANTTGVSPGQPAAPPVAAQPGQLAAPPVVPQPAQPAAPPVAQPAAAPATPVATNLNPQTTGYLTSQDAGAQINVRSSPSTSASTPHYGVPGDAVTLQQSATGDDGYVWYNVRFNASGATGWVRSDFVATGTPAANATAPVSGTGRSQTIQFAAGASSASLDGSVVRGTEDTYYVSASPGQYMQVSVSSTENNAVFQVYGEVEGTWSPLIGAGPGDDASTWADTLPGGGTGNFMIVVGPTRGNADYSLYVSIDYQSPDFAIAALDRLNRARQFDILDRTSRRFVPNSIVCLALKLCNITSCRGCY
ncbi:MAG: hypothetical protein EAZ61_10650 [Oscillatoriales cyanobacterium]|nr:MAG: hypothetical protein EAZ61_10650 [Oscillatoriales cyanobacterium]